MNDKEYIKQLELELDEAEAKYKDIYNSIRTVDKTILFIKRKINPLYRLFRNIYHASRKNDGNQRREQNSSHKKNTIKTPLEKLLLPEYKEPRINLVLDELSSEALNDKKTQKMIELAIKQAKVKKANLRIITRNNLANPKAFLEFLNQEKIIPPENYSFYSDAPLRLSNTVRKLEVGRNEFFIYSEKEND